MGMINEFAIGIGLPAQRDSEGTQVFYNEATGEVITDPAKIEAIKQIADRFTALVEYDAFLAERGEKRMALKYFERGESTFRL